MNETLNKIFENKDNKVTLSLSDYESIKAVFDENKSLEEEVKQLKESLTGIFRLFKRAGIPESVIKDIRDDKAKVDAKVVDGVIGDPFITTYEIFIKADNRKL